MEILGAVAAGTQLLGTAISVLDSITKLRDFLQHAPERHKRWRDNLNALSSTIYDIQINPTLQTKQVRCIIEYMHVKIDMLTDLCSCYTPTSKLNLIKKLDKAFSAWAVESRIVQIFESLEQDKTTLILAVSTLNRSVPTQSNIETTQDMFQDSDQEQAGRRSTHNGAGERPTQDGTHSPTYNQALVVSEGPQELVGFSSQQARQTASTYRRNGHTVNITGFERFPPQNNQQSTFTGIRATGDFCLLGDTTGRGIFLNDVQIEGNGRVDGTHTQAMAASWLSKISKTVKFWSKPKSESMQ